MTNVQPHHEVPLPSGADPDDPNNFDWQEAGGGEPGYRVFGRSFGSADEDISTLAVQYEDGTIVTEGDDGPRVYIGHTPHTADAARAFANTILQAADLADEWAGRSTTSPGADIAALLLTVERIHRKLRAAAGGSDNNEFQRCSEGASYLVTAKAAIADAVAVTR